MWGWKAIKEELSRALPWTRRRPSLCCLTPAIWKSLRMISWQNLKRSLPFAPRHRSNRKGDRFTQCADGCPASGRAAKNHTLPAGKASPIFRLRRPHIQRISIVVRVGLWLLGSLGGNFLDVAAEIMVNERAASEIGDRHLAVVGECLGKNRPQVIEAADRFAINLDDDVVQFEPVFLGGGIRHNALDVKPVMQADRLKEATDPETLDGVGPGRPSEQRRAHKREERPRDDCQSGSMKGPWAPSLCDFRDAGRTPASGARSSCEARNFNDSAG